MIVAILLAAVAFLAGYALLLPLSWQLSTWQRLILANPLGFSVISFCIFLISIFSSNIYSAQYLLGFLSLSVVSSGAVISFFRKQTLKDYATIRTLSQAMDVEKGFVALVTVAMSVFIIFLNLAWGPYDWDVMTLYDFRARVLAQDHQLDQLLEQSSGEGDRYTYYYSYPLMTSIVHAMHYILGSTDVMFFYSVIFFSFNSLAYLQLRKVSSLAIIRVPLFLLILSSPLFFVQAQTAYTNFPYTFFFSFGVLYFFEAFQKKQLPWATALLIAGAIWIRFVDPFYYVVIGLMILQVFIQKKPIYLLGLLPILFVRQSWAWYLSSYVAIHSTLIQVFTPQRLFETFKSITALELISMPAVIVFVMKIFFQQLGVITTTIAIVILLLHPKQRRGYWLEAVWFAGTVAIIMLGSFLFSLVFKDWSGIPGSAERMFSSLILILYVMLGKVINDWYHKS